MRHWGYLGTTAPLSGLVALAAATPALLILGQFIPAIAETPFQVLPNTPTHLAQALPSSTALAPEVLAEINRVRTNPTGYATWLEGLSQYYGGQVLALPGEDPIRTREGVGALQEAIATLQTMPPMALSAGMSQAAEDHVADTGAQGVVGSVGTDGSSLSDRAKRYGTFKGGFVELLSYGKKTSAAVVLQLVINDGDPNRGLRGELLNPKNRFIGIACGPHASRGAMCVIESSTEYAEKSGTVATSKAQPATNPKHNNASQGQSAKTTPKPVAQVDKAIAAPTKPKTKSQAVAKTLPASTPTTLGFPQSYLSPEEQAIFEETNRVRSNPATYAVELENLRQYFEGKLLKLPGQTPMETEEGVSAVEEAIQALKATKPMSVLSFSKGMSLGAKDHVNDLGPAGKAGHYGTDGSKPDKRISRYGAWKGLTGENISYSPMNPAKWHVIQLLIDDGVKDRGHRKAILKPDYRMTGVACGSHAVYTTMCVMEYATEYQEGR
ncbi:CAP domain-containing protein [Trichocoleus sp. FACHB-591]|uniref:CAP domain-containing protein n=1 Tax=Trichocoleus sp. FACHB-591 TaxID=2692872 RepID=UPI0018EF6B6B|nr:CAP domain-containing protein [Trichocoleus sp. FACHB-591]